MTLTAEQVDAAFRVYEPRECGKDGYPWAWSSIDRALRGGDPPTPKPGVKHVVRERAGHRCQRCGHPYTTGQSDPKWSPCDAKCRHLGQTMRGNLTGAEYRVLTVHHLIEGPDGKRDLRWWNLAALCQRCHLRIQTTVQMARVWPHEHTEWFKPHAAGWYAWTYLQLELSREETMARLDELLELERIA